LDIDRLSSGGSIIIRRFNALRKEVRIEVETWEKIWGYVAGGGEFENGAGAPGAPEKGPKIF